MKPDRQSSAAPIIVAILLLSVPLGAYVGGYFCLGEVSLTKPDLRYIKRNYSHKWIATAFGPAAWIESKLRGVDVQALSIAGAGPL